MPIFRGKMYFSQGKNGWTDEFFVSGDSMQDAFADLRLLAEGRAGLVAAGAELVHFVIGHLNGWRRTLSSGVRTLPIPLPAGEPFDGLLLQLQAGGDGAKPAYRRTWMMRGLPAGYRVSGADPNSGNNAKVNLLLASWLRLLGNGRYFLQVADKETGWHRINGMVPATLQNMSIDGRPMDTSGQDPAGTGFHISLADQVTIPAIDPETGQPSRVFLRDVRWSNPAAGRAAQLTGEKPVLASAPGLLTIRAALPKIGTFAGSGWLTLRRMVYEPIARGVAIGQSQRKCGKAILAQRVDARDLLATVTIPTNPQTGTTPIQPSQGDFSETTVIANAQDLIREVYKGYDPVADGKVNPVRIAPVKGRDNTYLVLCSGTDLSTDSATGIPQDLAAAFALPSSFTAGLAEAIVDATQPGATLIVAGHSLGGMVLQNAIWWGIPSDRNVSNCITYGSPLTLLQPPTTTYRMFVLPGDKVPYLSLLSLLFPPIADAHFTILDPGDIPSGVVNRHTKYQDCVDLQKWSPIGTPLTNPDLQTMTVGKWKTYPLPRLTI